MTTTVASPTRPVAICGECGLDLYENDAGCSRCGGDSNQTWTIHLTQAMKRDVSPPEAVGSSVTRRLEATLAGNGPGISSSAGLRPSDGHVSSGIGEAGPDRAERYQVIEAVGRGAMGLVLKVHDTALDEIVALKVLDPQVGISDLAVERFKQEVRIARRILHPNVARIYDLFQWHQHLAISQQFITGADLEHHLTGEPLPVERLVHYLRHICSALQAAHDIGVVHRDLKPGNIRVNEKDIPHILDFGLAALSDNIAAESHKWLVGTPSHMAPEQIRSPETVDQRSDIYSLGVILFRMATGQLPFLGRSAPDLIRQHLAAAPPHPRALNPRLPVELDGAILRCLNKEPELRFQTARAVYEEVRRATGRGDAGTVPPRPKAPNRVARVLVVEDSVPLRTALKTTIEESGMVCLESGDGFVGVETALASRPDFVLLDVEMPVLDGRETLRILKSNPTTASIPVVMMTEAEDVEEEVLFRELGADMTLVKPVKRDIVGLLSFRFRQTTA